MEKLKAGKPVTVDNVTLLPIERLTIHSKKMDFCHWIAAQKEPYAIILRDSKGIRAFDMEGNDVSIECLMKAVSDLIVL
jgi:uncharacterized spore protein YtfJ